MEDFDIAKDTQTIVNDGTLDLIKAKKWLEAYPKSLHGILQKILLNINYVDKDMFFKCLKQSVDTFKAAI
jgi:hypothetical protein